ncbi:hypothetical protein GUJ93_ZPchr0011g28689 [Zizania palustris]|uniref:Uncharacterized protein n=1 Tax=Zizania palustris TaxID=103762 RepID=A0A8J6BIU4_ZIZPA|nr:hypothetical protein GUJ93_ZPchr0011g28689 [Zizania palustris]
MPPPFTSASRCPVQPPRALLLSSLDRLAMRTMAKTLQILGLFQVLPRLVIFDLDGPSTISAALRGSRRVSTGMPRASCSPSWRRGLTWRLCPAHPLWT